jgi:MFS family permease
MSAQAGTAETFETRIPARLDRLPWSRWHWLVVLALGAVWILDGLEVTIVGAIGATLQKPQTLGLSSAEVGAAGAIYVAGAVTGALFFGHLTDRFGRKKLFMVTLGVYLAATVATAFSWSAWAFFVFRFLTGTGIGGEYSAINSAIDELIPARVRGWVDLAINGSWWIGTAAGAALSLVLLNPKLLAVDTGWRVCFGLGAILGLGILLTRRLVPESPRWLLTHDRRDEADRIVEEIERRVSASTGEELREPKDSLEMKPVGTVGFVTLAKTLFADYRRRTILGLALMSSQAFAYNAVFFTYALVLTTFYKVNPASVGWYILPFAVGNFLGPLLLGRLFDVVGRRAMISLSYGAAGVMLAVTGWLFQHGTLTAFWQTVAWTVIFFFASAGASAAYLTVSEVFPLEIRAMAIAFFYGVATAIGGITGPLLFGILVGTKSAGWTMVGFLIGAGWLILAAIAEVFLGVDAEQRSLEEIADPLSAEDADEPTSGERGEVRARPERAAWRPGSDRTMWSPRPAFAGLPGYEDTDLADELDALERAAAEGPLSERELFRRARASTWGPGRAHRALRAAVRDGRLVRRGRTYVATQTSSR